MHYDICMRSIERIEDHLADMWSLYSRFWSMRGYMNANQLTPRIADFETLDFLE